VYKIAALIGGLLLMSGVALAGTLTSLDSTNTPTIGTSLVSSTGTTTRADDRGREAEARNRENEAGEDLRGPCDEAEHANDPRCTDAPATAPRVDDDVDDDGARDDVNDDRGGDNSGRGSSSSGPSDNSGRGGGSDDHGGESGHGGDD
jgi:hypothetical protein